MGSNTIDLPAARSPDAISALQAAAISLYTAWSSKELESALEKKAVPDHFVASLNAFFDAYDAYIAVIDRETSFHCRRGCVACCTDNPRGTTPIELLRLYAHLQQREDFPELRQTIKRQAIAFNELLQRTQDESEAQRLWKFQRHPCPLLNENALCSAYSVRPIPCRMFVSLTDPAWCDPAHPKYNSAVNPHLEPLPPMRRLLLEMGEKLGLDRLPTNLFGGLDELADIFDGTPFRFTTNKSNDAI